MLALPDIDARYEVAYDASGFGCGAVLLQQLNPVAVYSYKLNDAELPSAPGEQDLLAVVMGAEAMVVLP